MQGQHRAYMCTRRDLFLTTPSCGALSLASSDGSCRMLMRVGNMFGFVASSGTTAVFGIRSRARLAASRHMFDVTVHWFLNQPSNPFLLSDSVITVCLENFSTQVAHLPPVGVTCVKAAYCSQGPEQDLGGLVLSVALNIVSVYNGPLARLCKCTRNISSNSRRKKYAAD